MDAMQNLGMTKPQVAFAMEYAQSNNMTKACSAADLSRVTGYAWLKKSIIMDAIQELRARAMADAWTSLSAGLSAAVDTVKAVLDSDATTTNNKLRAAELIITQAQALLEKQEIIARLDRLEEHVG